MIDNLPEYPRFWKLEDRRVIPSGPAEWEENHKDALNFLLGQTFIDPGFCIRTVFVGFQRSATNPPTLFQTEVHSDMGMSCRHTLTFDDAARMQTMECQRIVAIVERSIWEEIADLKTAADSRIYP